MAMLLGRGRDDARPGGSPGRAGGSGGGEPERARLLRADLHEADAVAGDDHLAALGVRQDQRGAVGDGGVHGTRCSAAQSAQYSASQFLGLSCKWPCKLSFMYLSRIRRHVCKLENSGSHSGGMCGASDMSG